jgi:hypothetical protein
MARIGDKPGARINGSGSLPSWRTSPARRNELRTHTPLRLAAPARLAVSAA